jgi:hypothetical protein
MVRLVDPRGDLKHNARLIAKRASPAFIVMSFAVAHSNVLLACGSMVLLVFCFSLLRS